MTDAQEPFAPQTGPSPPTEPRQNPARSGLLLPSLRNIPLFAGVVFVLWWAFLAFPENAPLSRSTLSACLPKAPSGWTAGRIRTSNPSSVEGNFSLEFTSSCSWRTFARGDRTITVEIWDWGGDYPYHLPIDIPGWMNGETVRVGGEEGRLTYNERIGRGRLRVRYLDRFYLVVQGRGVQPQELRSWYARIDRNRLRSEFNRLHATASNR